MEKTNEKAKPSFKVEIQWIGIKNDELIGKTKIELEYIIWWKCKESLIKELEYIIELVKQQSGAQMCGSREKIFKYKKQQGE